MIRPALLSGLLLILAACSAATDPTASTPASIVMISGDAQTASVGGRIPLPVIVQVRDADGLPVSAVSVSFTSADAATFGHTPVLTDAAGNAQTTVTLGSTAGSTSIVASAAGVASPVAFSFTALAAAANSINVASGDGQVDSVGRALANPLVVKVTDQFGNAVVGAIVAWTTTSGQFTTPVLTFTGPDGTTSARFTLPTVAGVARPIATLGGKTATATFNLTAQ